jgi:predicted ester cyclase
MQIQRMLSLMVISCIGLALTSGQQRKPTATPQNTTGVANQAQPAPVEQRKPVAPVQNRPGLPGQVPLPSVEQNRVVVHRVFDDLFTRGRYDLIDQIYTKDCAAHFGNRNFRLEQAVAEGKGWRSAAPDLLMTVDHMDVERDFVIVDWTAKGTNTGKGNGIPATGKRILVHGKSRFRVVNGKIAEVWYNYDRDDLFKQLGVPPKLGHLYDSAQDFLFALNQRFSGKDMAGTSAQSN